jgi:hypothetical protein
LGHLDLEALEIHIRSAVHGIGAVMLEELLNSDSGGYKGRTLSGEGGCLFEFKEYRDKKLLTLLGPVTVKRAYYHEPESKKGWCPKDRVLDIVGVSFSPGLRRIMSRVGAYRPFGLGYEDIKEMAGIDVNTKEIERVSHRLGSEAEEFQKREADLVLSGKVVPIKAVPKMYICMDGTGVPVVKAETVGRQGKSEGGQAKTREVKLGCVFTQTTVDEKGYPVRDEGSTSYVGRIETAEEFSFRIYAEAIRRGLHRAEKVCVIGDGALWIWNIADEQFYGAIQIIDLYHAREHYWSVARLCLGSDKQGLDQWTEKRRIELDQGKVEEVIAAIKELPPSTDEAKKVVEKEINFFEKNKDRMRYDEFRRQGLFVGSGVLEAGCRTVVGQRLKQSGMHWTVAGANHIIALRCCFLSNRWEDFWEHRVGLA